MKQKTKQKLVNNQIQSIRNSIKTLRELTKKGLYIDRRQRTALNAIAMVDMVELAS